MQREIHEERETQLTVQLQFSDTNKCDVGGSSQEESRVKEALVAGLASFLPFAKYGQHVC